METRRRKENINHIPFFLGAESEMGEISYKVRNTVPLLM